MQGGEQMDLDLRGLGGKGGGVRGEETTATLDAWRGGGERKGRGGHIYASLFVLLCSFGVCVFVLLFFFFFFL